MQVSFDISKADRALVSRIVKRSRDVLKTYSPDTRLRPVMEMQMDLIATHANGCPLDFARLLKADDFNLLHDVLGIERHLDRDTGQLLHCFLPRFARKAQGSVRGDGQRLRQAIASKRAAREARQ